MNKQSIVVTAEQLTAMGDAGYPVMVNMPEAYRGSIPVYIRNRVIFVTCKEFLLARHEELHAEAQAKLPNEASDRVINTTLGSLKDLI